MKKSLFLKVIRKLKETKDKILTPVRVKEINNKDFCIISNNC